MENIFLSIVIPAYNESKRLPKTLDRISNYLNQKRWSDEIVVVDDGSNDNTKDIAYEFCKINPNIKLLINPINKGKGYSVRRGILDSRGKYILFTDADLSTPIEDVEKLMSHIDKGYDIAIGSRSIKGSRVILHQPFARQSMGKIFNKIVQIFTVRKIIDTQCGFKLFTNKAAKAIFTYQRLNEFSFDVEALFIAKKFNLKIKEVPVTWCNSPSSKVRILKDPILMLFDLLRIRFYELMGFYRKHD